ISACRRSASRPATCCSWCPARRSTCLNGARGWTAPGASSASSTTHRWRWRGRCSATSRRSGPTWSSRTVRWPRCRSSRRAAPAELSSTLLIAIDDARRVRDELQRLMGIDRHVRLEVGSAARIAGVFEGGRHTDEKLSTVQYVRFPLDPTLLARVATGAPLTLVVDHPTYRGRVPLPEPVRASLAADLGDPAVADRALREVRDGS